MQHLTDFFVIHKILQFSALQRDILINFSPHISINQSIKLPYSDPYLLEYVLSTRLLIRRTASALSITTISILKWDLILNLNYTHFRTVYIYNSKLSYIFFSINRHYHIISFVQYINKKKGQQIEKQNVVDGTWLCDTCS
jgi:hypothetical protein